MRTLIQTLGMYRMVRVLAAAAVATAGPPPVARIPQGMRKELRRVQLAQAHRMLSMSKTKFGMAFFFELMVGWPRVCFGV